LRLPLGCASGVAATSRAAYGCDMDTLMKHYVAMDEQRVTDALFARMHGIKPSG
jgi:hypothetical protein